MDTVGGLRVVWENGGLSVILAMSVANEVKTDHPTAVVPVGTIFNPKMTEREWNHLVADVALAIEQAKCDRILDSIRTPSAKKQRRRK